MGNLRRVLDGSFGDLQQLGDATTKYPVRSLGCGSSGRGVQIRTLGLRKVAAQPRLRDTGLTMSAESTTPDLVELTRRSIGAAEDIEAALSFYAPDAVWDASPWGMGVFEGQTAVRGFFEDWRSSYSDMEWKAEEIRDLGNELTFAVILQKAHVVGSSGSVQLRYASVAEWIDGLIVRNTTYTDIDEARAAAERLAQERG